MRLLFSVTNVFTIPSRGVVLVPEITPVGEERFRIGDSLRLRRPDGAEDIVRIDGLKQPPQPHLLGKKCEVLVMLSGKKKEGHSYQDGSVVRGEPLRIVPGLPENVNSSNWLVCRSLGRRH